MEEHIHQIRIMRDYVKYEVNLYSLQDRVHHFTNWSEWRDINEEGFDFYRRVEPEMLVKRNKIIHIFENGNK